MKNNTLLNKCIVAFILFLGTGMLFGQSNTFPLKNANWYIGDTWESSGRARGVEFPGTTSSASPSVSLEYGASKDPNYKHYMDENYTASVSDGLGNLLFYTNGFRVWNENHDQVARVFDYDKTEILPIPGQPGKYYIMGSRQLKTGQEGALVYSVYDIDANGGQGATIPGKENIEVAPYMTMRMTSFVNPHDGLPYLVAVGPNPTIAYHEQRLVFDTFYVYKIEDDNGPVLVSPSSPEPGVFEFDIYRANAASLEFGPNLTEEDRQSQIKISPNLERLGMSHPDLGDGLFMLFDVQVTAGAVRIFGQNNLRIRAYNPAISFLRPISIEFSPSSDLSYISYQWTLPSAGTWGYSLYQIDIVEALNGGSQNDVLQLLRNEVDYIGSDTLLANPHQIQRGIDDRIYVGWGFPNNVHHNMGVVFNPDIQGPGAGFNPEGLFIDNSPSSSFRSQNHRIPPLVGDIDNQIRAGEIANNKSTVVGVSPQDVMIYPNPSQGIFEVVMPKSFDGIIEVLDVTGRVVYRMSVADQLRTRIDLQKEASGMYFMNIISSQETIVKKVLKL